jgi:hypothetical protein
MRCTLATAVCVPLWLPLVVIARPPISSDTVNVFAVSRART